MKMQMSKHTHTPATQGAEGNLPCECHVGALICSIRSIGNSEEKDPQMFTHIPHARKHKPWIFHKGLRLHKYGIRKQTEMG